MYKFRVGDTANGQETSEEIIEANNYVEALEQLIEHCNLYCKPADDETDEHITRIFDRLRLPI